MRNAMLATIVLAFFGAMASTAVLLPEILEKNAGSPPPEQSAYPGTNKKDVHYPQKTTHSSSSLPGSGAIANDPVANEAVASAQEWAEKMFTAGLTKDFGAVSFGTQLFHRFEVTNIYASPVEISGLRVGCCCLKAAPGKRILQPGESTTIDVALDTRQFTGPNTQTVKVAFGPSPGSACILKVSAVSQTDVAFVPERVSFGTVASGRTSVQSIDVEYNGTVAWKVEKVIVAKELPFEATLSELVRRPGNVRYRLTVTLKDDARPGRIRDYIYLRTNQIDLPDVPVLVTATVQTLPKEGSF